MTQVFSNPAFWWLTAIFLGGLGFAAVRCRDVVAPGYRVAYMILWILFGACICVGAYYHTGQRQLPSRSSHAYFLSL